ncbi:MAG: leucine-rich repeat domain-containing protein [Alphaproteobacteria bacterium]|jgi:hypothetical protein|nr:leucine-rich repeat domain-containing protein [Alphaproteobacteria bacterium]MBP9878376.1 leucine-rich repeat domain-containing protein [Alphaproteobacteria bacterium]
MTFFTKIQRTIPAFKPLLPKAPVHSFHTSSTRVNPLRSMPAAAIPVQQRFVNIPTRTYANNNHKMPDDFTPFQKLLIGAGVGAFCTQMFISTAFAMGPTNGLKTTPSDHDQAVFIFEKLQSEMPELASDEIASGLSFEYFCQFSDEDAYDRHLITFAKSVERYNQTRRGNEQSLSLGEAFKAYKNCRQAILDLIDGSRRYHGFKSFAWYDPKLTYVPPEIAHLKNTENPSLYLSLYFHGCRISALPDQLKELAPTLERLHFTDATFDVMPQVLFRLTGLTDLQLMNGHLQKISPDILDLTKLQYLDLSYNYIDKIPEDLQAGMKEVKFKMTPTPPFCKQFKI